MTNKIITRTANKRVIYEKERGAIVPLNAKSPNTLLVQSNSKIKDDNPTLSALDFSEVSIINQHTSNFDDPHQLTAEQLGSNLPQWNASSIQGFPVAETEPTEGYVLTWNGSKYIPSQSLTPGIITGSILRWNGSRYEEATNVIVNNDGEVNFVNSDSSVVAFSIKGMVSQTANLTEWKDSSGNILAFVGADGSSSFGGTTTVSDLNIDSLDEATSSNPIYNSENLTWNGSYWNGNNAVNTNGKIFLDVESTKNSITITPDDRNSGNYKFSSTSASFPNDLTCLLYTSPSPRD